MSQRALISVIILFCLNIATVNAQLPTLDPSQTVNTATGEMGFNLPLGAVAGRNGTSFPISLGYKAGIQYSQEASPVGLGFGFGAGSITRKVNFVPDDNDGGTANYEKGEVLPSCDVAWWKYFVRACMIVVGIVLAILSYYTQGATIPFVIAIASFVFDTVSLMTYDPNNFVAGGEHSGQYEPLRDPNHPELDGRGFFKEKGFNRDIPDLYFVSTPFISGELVWCGGYNPGESSTSRNGYFVFKNTMGGSKKENRTVKVDYNLEDEKFVITLADGTRLFFEDTQNGGTYCYKSFWKNHPERGVDCDATSEVKQKQSVPEQWLLTKVLYPDYIDGDGDLNPETNPAQDKGAWLTFGYKRTTPVNARPLPICMQASGEVSLVSTPGSDPAAENASVFEEVQLEWVRTPNQSAQYFYTPARLDNLWFKSEMMEWKTYGNWDALSPTPAAVIERKPDADPDLVYVKGLRLDSILVYTNEDDTLRRIRFSTDYTLKPGSFHSYSKDADGKFVTVSGNPNAACLTLKSVEIADKKSEKTYNVYFNYIENATKVWDETKYAKATSANPVGFYIEQKDYWGYFSANTTNNNNFNTDGYYSKAEQASYWSLNKIELPSGMKISWEYEPQRYDAANNLPVKVSSDGDKRKFGGGIRVRKMGIDDGTGKTIDRSYFYTDVIGDFNETENNSSGHATVEPYPYLVNEYGDPRKERARGGYYSGAKVGYEMVQVVDGFKPAEVYNKAPNGFTVYEYITPKDDSPAETFINEGKYGEIENSWKRGILKTKSIYNSKKKMIGSEKYFYEFIEQQKQSDYTVFNLLDSLSSYLYEHRCGWVKPVKTETMINGVTTTTYQKYATDLNPKNTPDYLHFSRKELQITDVGTNAPASSIIDAASRVLTCRTKFLKGTGSSDAYDYILVKTLGSSYIRLEACVNVDEISKNASWINHKEYIISSDDDYVYLVGAALFKTDDSNPQDDDLVVLAKPANDLLRYLYVVVFHDIGLDDKGSNLLVCTDGAPTVTIIKLNTADNAYIANSGGLYGGGLYGRFNHPAGSIIGNFYGDDPTKPDFIILTGHVSTNQYPGDIVKDELTGTDNSRNIFAFTDFEEGTFYREEKVMKLWRNSGTELYSYYGDQGFMTDADEGGTENDLVIVGPGNNAVTGTFHYDTTRHMSYQIFNDISWTGNPLSTEPCYISFTTPCSNCNNEKDQILFNLRPNYGDQWISTRFSGFYDEGNDIMKFVFFGEGTTYRHFYLLHYLPVYYEGDYDGAPNRTYKRANDGSILLSTTIPAYWKYPAMDATTTDTLHMIAPACGAATMKFPSGTTDNVLCGELFTTTNSRKVLASSAATWAALNGTGKAYLPVSSYVWNVPMDASGTPTADYTAFNYITGADNSENWKLKDSICKYTENSQVKETAKPTSNDGCLHSTAIYGHKGTLPIAVVTKASFEECGVFTCDYDDNRGGYFDKENSWEKGIGTDPDNPKPSPTVALSTDNLFGTKSVRVYNSWGPTRNCRLSKGKDYVMTAWVKVESGKAWMAADYRYKLKSTDNTWPVTGLTRDVSAGLHGKELGPTGGKWVLLKLEIPAAAVLKEKDWANNNWYARVYAGSVIGGTVYIQDIRLEPKDALVASTYYDTLLQLPLLSVDANNHPATKLTYDGFGRPVRWEKLNLKEIPGAAGFATLLQEKSYSTRNEGIYLYTPSAGDKYAPGEQLVIKWRNERNRDVQIFYSSTNGAPWTLITGVAHVAGQREYNYTWTIPTEIATGSNYGIKIVDIAAPTEIYDQSGTFAIGSIKVLFPTGGELFYTGMPYEIRYLSAGSDPITISVNGTSVASGVANTGTYIWTVPFDFIPSKDVRIQISSGGVPAESGKFTVKKRSFFRRYIYNLLNPQ